MAQSNTAAQFLFHQIKESFMCFMSNFNTSFSPNIVTVQNQTKAVATSILNRSCTNKVPELKKTIVLAKRTNTHTLLTEQKVLLLLLLVDQEIVTVFTLQQCRESETDEHLTMLRKKKQCTLTRSVSQFCD
jgi:hypothetical protein